MDANPVYRLRSTDMARSFLRRSMGKKRGRPKLDDGETRMVRAYADIADMIGWLVRLEGGTVAGLLDPLIRAPILARYARIQHLVKQIKDAEAQASEAAKKRPAR